MGIFSNYYMYVVHQDDNILHLKRNPTWKSLVLFLVLWAITHFVSLQAQYLYLGYLCYALGLWFCYLATEKYEECIFDKQKGAITMMNARILQKYTVDYKRKIVSELSEVVSVKIESVKPTILGTAHQIVLLYASGLTLSVTAAATYGNRKSHEDIAKTIANFLKVEVLNLDSRSSKADKKTD